MTNKSPKYNLKIASSSRQKVSELLLRKAAISDVVDLAVIQEETFYWFAANAKKKLHYSQRQAGNLTIFLLNDMMGMFGMESPTFLI